MKKKISFRMELVLFMLISLLISFSVAFLIRNQTGLFHTMNENERIRKIYDECVQQLEEQLLRIPLSDEQESEAVLNNYRYLVGYAFYLVDSKGNVLTATENDVKAIDATQIYDGMKTYSTSGLDDNVFRMQGCDYLKDDVYLYYSYLRFDENDTGMVFGALAGAILCFFLLIWGRISYISRIRTAVAGITAGNLSYRITCQYHNELRALSEEINEMAEALETEDKKRNEFLTNISHDIRTPLTTILGYLEMIREEKYGTREEMQGYLDIMKRKGDFLASMLEDFFQYSKLQSGDIQMDCMEFELNEMLRQFYEDEVDEFVQNSLHLQISLCEQNTKLYGDTELIARVINNLLSNALKYSRRNTTIIMKSFLDNQSVCFMVKNTPKEPVSREQLVLMFERQYKCNAARSEGGSGLGLTIVRNIIRLHGGSVYAELEGEDIVFTVMLPQGKGTRPEYSC